MRVGQGHRGLFAAARSERAADGAQEFRLRAVSAQAHPRVLHRVDDLARAVAVCRAVDADARFDGEARRRGLPCEDTLCRVHEANRRRTNCVCRWPGLSASV